MNLKPSTNINKPITSLQVLKGLTALRRLAPELTFAVKAGDQILAYNAQAPREVYILMGMAPSDILVTVSAHGARGTAEMSLIMKKKEGEFTLIAYFPTSFYTDRQIDFLSYDGYNWDDDQL